MHERTFAKITRCGQPGQPPGGDGLPGRTSPSATSAPPAGPVASWRKFSLGTTALGTQGVLGYLHPALGVVLAIADIAIPVLLAVVLLAVILCGSKETYERVFRLLRWIVNRPEPPAPPPPSPQRMLHSRSEDSGSPRRSDRGDPAGPSRCGENERYPYTNGRGP